MVGWMEEHEILWNEAAYSISSFHTGSPPREV